MKSNHTQTKKDTENKLEALEEKFISGDIAKGSFEKFSTRYKNILLETGEKSPNPMDNSSNCRVFRKKIKNGRFIKNGQKISLVVPKGFSSNFFIIDLLSLFKFKTRLD